MPVTMDHGLVRLCFKKVSPAAQSHCKWNKSKKRRTARDWLVADRDHRYFSNGLFPDRPPCIFRTKEADKIRQGQKPETSAFPTHLSWNRYHSKMANKKLGILFWVWTCGAAPQEFRPVGLVRWIRLGILSLSFDLGFLENVLVIWGFFWFFLSRRPSGYLRWGFLVFSQFRTERFRDTFLFRRWLLSSAYLENTVPSFIMMQHEKSFVGSWNCIALCFPKACSC